MAKQHPCVDLVIAAANETLGNREAERLIRTFAEMVEAQQIRNGDGIEEAIKKVNRHLKTQEIIKAMQAKRNAMLNVVALQNAINIVDDLASSGKISRMEAITDLHIGDQILVRGPKGPKGEKGQILQTRQSISKQQYALTVQYISALEEGLRNIPGKDGKPIDLFKVYSSGKLSEEIFLELGHMVTEVDPVIEVKARHAKETPPPPPKKNKNPKRQAQIDDIVQSVQNASRGGKEAGAKRAAFNRWRTEALDDPKYKESFSGLEGLSGKEYTNKLYERFESLYDEGIEQQAMHEQAMTLYKEELSSLQARQAIELQKAKQSGPQWDRRKTSYLLERGDVDENVATMAKQIADVIYDTREVILTRYNLAGGLVDPKAKRTIHQTHNTHRIMRGYRNDKKAAYAAWVEEILDDIDVEKSFDGELDIEKALKDRFNKIMAQDHSDEFGPVKVDEDGNVIEGPKKPKQEVFFHRRGSLAKRGSKQDLFVFKSPEAEWKYNQKYGSMSLNDAISSELHYYGHSTAMMENMGADPDGVLNALIKVASEKDKNDGVIAHKASALAIPPRTAFEQVMGYLDNPASPTAKKVNTVVKWLKWQQAMSKLGGITISAIADKPQMHFTLTYHGLSQTEAFMANIKALLPKGQDEKIFISALGVANDYTAASLNSRMTFSGGEPRAAMARKTQDAMFKMTLMHQWNDGHKGAVAVALMHAFGEYAGRNLNDLPADMAKSLRMYGITDSDWRNLSSVATRASDGRMYIMPENIRTLAGSNPSITTQKAVNALEMKFRTWITDIANEAVITPGARERIYARMGTKKGTAAGALVEMLNYFRSFPISVASKILTREAKGFEGQISRRFARGVGLLTGSAIAGYASGAIRDMLNGKTPKPWTNEDGSPNTALLMDSLARGGGLGIYSDLLFYEYDNGYRSMSKTMAGPILGSGMEGLTLLGQTIRAPFSDEKDVPKVQISKFLQANTPLVGLPVIKMGLDYTLFYHINEILEPGYLRKMEKGIRDRTGQEFWLANPSDIWSD